MCVAGASNLAVHDVKAEVETCLKGEEEIVVEGYRWFGCNRCTLHRKAVRGSGGVGVLIRKEVLKQYAVKVLDSDVDDVLWVRLSNEEEEEGSLVLAACYLIPETYVGGWEGRRSTILGKTGSQVPLTRPDNNVW